MGFAPLSKSEIERYSRHLVLPEVGIAGQQKLKNASVLLVGIGGLGSPAALYLAAAGVGRIGIVDSDVVDLSNLQRQIIHGMSDVGHSKLISAKNSIAAINPQIRVDSYDALLTSENAREICAPYDIILDGTDNFATRYLVNDICVLTGKVNVYGSIYRFDGQVSVFDAKNGPCYRCLYPQPPAPGDVPNCVQGGVLGVLPGIVGSLQANETIKLILETGKNLTGRLLLFDALNMQFDEMRIAKDPHCPICGDHPVITDLIDYDEFCGVEDETLLEEVEKISPKEAARVLSETDVPLLLDVRDAAERTIASIPGSIHIPLAELENRLSELNPDSQLIIFCRSGIRSARALRMLQQRGFSDVKNLNGGILAWADEIDPSLPKY